jgi:hypothetical protein
MRLGTRLHYLLPALRRKADKRRRRDFSVRQVAESMTFRIETAARGRLTVFILSGRVEKEAIALLRKLFERQTDYQDIALDLKDVCMIDREVMRFFASCEAEGVKIENCAPYIREWMKRERD